MRFASHRDIARAVERGVRKAGLPVAYSAGFSPHPKISYSGGAPTGAASEAEYLELSLSSARDPAEVRDRLDAALPEGIDVVEVVELANGTAAPRLEASEWEVILPGIAPDAAAQAARAFLAASAVETERLTSKGIRRLDARAAVVTLEVSRRADEDRHAGCAILRMVVQQLTPAVRPDDILAALRQISALAPSSPPLVTRLAQGPLGREAAAGTGAPDATQAAESEGTSGFPAEVPLPSRQSGGQGQGKAARSDAEDAVAAPRVGERVRAAPARRGGSEDGPRAREPDWRDCPDARNRAG
jgi:radical SAM-linked protein